MLDETLSKGFSNDLQTMKKHAKKFVVLVSGEQITVSDRQLLDDLEKARGSLCRIARKSDERIRTLSFALTNVDLCKKKIFPELVKPVIDKTKDGPAWITQTLERAELKQKCRRVFSQLPDTIKDPGSAAKWMQEELEKVDLARCKQILAEYTCSSVEITILSKQIGNLCNEVELRVYPQLKKG